MLLAAVFVLVGSTQRPSSLPSGKHTKNYGKSPCLMGKSTISMAIFNSYVKLPEGKWPYLLIRHLDFVAQISFLLLHLSTKPWG
jgi:hypothetical protein